MESVRQHSRNKSGKIGVDSVRENKAHVAHITLNLVNSRSCLGENGIEMYMNVEKQ